jgi:hypothetical protein
VNVLNLLAQLRGGPQTPTALLSALVALVTESARVELAGLAELATGADLIGPRPPPPALSRLFADTAARYGLPAELLGATAIVLSGVDPDFEDGSRVGLLGLPLAATGSVPSGALRCTYSDLLNLDPVGLAAVALNVDLAAAEIARLRLELPSKLAGAIFRYCELGYAHREPDESLPRARVDAGHIAGAALLMGLRELDPDFTAAAARAFGQPVDLESGAGPGRLRERLKDPPARGNGDETEASRPHRFPDPER